VSLALNKNREEKNHHNKISTVVPTLYTLVYHGKCALHICMLCIKTLKIQGLVYQNFENTGTCVSKLEKIQGLVYQNLKKYRDLCIKTMKIQGLWSRHQNSESAEKVY
jgi:hypothetical protein